MSQVTLTDIKRPKTFQIAIDADAHNPVYDKLRRLRTTRRSETPHTLVCCAADMRMYQTDRHNPYVYVIQLYLPNICIFYVMLFETVFRSAFCSP